MFPCASEDGDSYDYPVPSVAQGCAAWVEPSAGNGGPTGGYGFERAWYLIDLSVRALLSDEPIHASYAHPPLRLFFEGEEPGLTDQFRNAFLEAWDVAG